MEKEIDIEVQEAQWVPYRINPRRNTPRHILIKLRKTKHKERLLKATSTIQGRPHMLNSWSYSRNSACQKGMAGYIYSTQEKKSTIKITVPRKDLIQTDGEIKSFSDMQKLGEFSISKEALQKMLKGFI